MKYLKIVNVPLSEFCNHASLTNGEKRIPWSECGFNVATIRAKIVQFEDDNGDYVQYLPIDKVTKVRALITKMSDILSQEGFTAEVVEEVTNDDQATWVTNRETSKRKLLVKAERKKKSIEEEAAQPE